ncbi:MAG: ATP-grasp domain-containing protein [Porticoccaceae bacterium]|nr:ATP-grasp domain-containing protein [Porticoccaceae bacterium]
MRTRLDIVVLGSSPTGLYVVREAARAGLNMGLLDATRGCAFASRYPVFAAVMPPASLLDWLRGLNQSSPAPLLVPTSDIWIEAVMQLRLSPAVALRFPAYADMAGALLDKLSFHTLCKSHGMETPGVWQARNKEELRALAAKVPLPCILKPALIHRARGFLRGRKVLLARNEAEFLTQVAAMPEGLGEWLVQEIIPGAESAITLFGGYIDRSGAPRQVFTGRKLRQYPAGFGSASLVTSVPCKETESLTLKFLSKIGFRGICGAEFKRDPRDGRLKIIEINPRPTLWFQATHDAGCRILEAAWRDMAGQEQIAEIIPRTDVLWRYLFKDMASAQFYRSQHDFIFPAPDVSGAEWCAVKSSPVFDIRDPLPALAEPFEFARKALERRG